MSGLTTPARAGVVAVASRMHVNAIRRIMRPLPPWNAGSLFPGHRARGRVPRVGIDRSGFSFARMPRVNNGGELALRRSARAGGLVGLFSPAVIVGDRDDGA